MSLRVLLADDHQIVREGVRLLLEKEGIEVVGEASNGRDAVRLATAAHDVDVAVLDLSMPVLGGLEAAREIRQLCPGIGIVVLSIYAEEHQVIAALRIGIRGYVVKTQPFDELLHAIREVARAGIYLSPAVSRVLVDAYLAGGDLPADPLTPRERQVLQLVAEGKTTKEIAVLLDLSVKTAESYRGRLMDKLNIHDTASLVRYAIRLGLIQA